jgi:hypothetical protein
VRSEFKFDPVTGVRLLMDSPDASLEQEGAPSSYLPRRTLL